MPREPLRVMVDARKIRDYGIGTYIQSLAHHLSEVRPEWEFLALTGTGPHASEPLPRSWQVIPVSYGKYSLGEFLSLGRRVRSLAPSIFHSPHYTTPFAAGVPIIVTIHDLIHLLFPDVFNTAKRAYAWTMVRHALRGSAMVLTDSQAVKESILERFRTREDKIRVVPLGISGDFFAGARREALAREFRRAFGVDRPFLLYVGNVKPHKGLEILLKAFEVLSGRDKDPVLVLAGGDPVEARALLERNAPRAGREGRVKVLGRISSADVKRAYAAAELFVFPSRYEGFGLPALEAMAAGTPVVCADGGALPETVSDAAVVVRAGNVEELLDAITTLWSDRTKQAVLRERGLRRAQEFTWRQTAEHVAAVYEDVLTEERAG